MFSSSHAVGDDHLLLEEIKNQLDRLEASLKEEQEKTERALLDLKSMLQSMQQNNGRTAESQGSGGGGEQDGVQGLLSLAENLPAEFANSLPALKPLLENPQKLLSSPIMKLLPLLANDTFAKSFEVFQKIQEGKLPAPSEILPIARTFLGSPSDRAFTLQNSDPKLQKVQTIRRDLEKNGLEFAKTLEKLQEMNKEALALVELMEILLMRKQQVR